MALVVFLGVEGLLIWFLLKFKARRGRVAAQIHGNTRLEIGWTVGAAVILVFITAVTFIKLPGIKNPAGVRHRRPGQPGRGQRAVRLHRPAAAAEGRRRCTSWSTASSTCGATSTRPRATSVFAYEEMVVPVGMTVLARHHLRRRRALVVDPEARRQDGRDPRLHQQDVVQGHQAGRSTRASAPSCAGATTRTCTARSRRCRRRVPGLVRPRGGGHQGRAQEGARQRRHSSSRSKRPRSRPSRTDSPDPMA